MSIHAAAQSGTPIESAAQAAAAIDGPTGLNRQQLQAFLPLVRAVLGHDQNSDQPLPPAIASALAESLERLRAVSGTPAPDANTVNAQLGIALGAIRDEARRQMDALHRERAEVTALLDGATAAPSQPAPVPAENAQPAEVDAVAILKGLQALGGQVTRKS